MILEESDMISSVHVATERKILTAIQLKQLRAATTAIRELEEKLAVAQQWKEAVDELISEDQGVDAWMVDIDTGELTAIADR